jgi:hypothetical protein
MFTVRSAFVVFSLLATFGFVTGFAESPTRFPVPRSKGDALTLGLGIQRTMRLLSESTPTSKNSVRILIYGQSITEQEWTREVEADLRKRFPDANLIFENRAIGGHSSQILWKTAEADLYPFQPDLMIFYVYGDHNRYRDIIRKTREETCAEILLLTDHLNADANIEEETDPGRLNPSSWVPWFSYSFLPSLAKEFQCGLVDQRDLWKQYLRDNKLEPKDLLKDNVHLNEHGNYLMGELVKAYLIRRPESVDPKTEAMVSSIAPPQASDNKLRIPFRGNRIDVVIDRSASKQPVTYDVRIDDKRPSEFPACYTTTRSTGYNGTNWPCLLRIQPGTTPLLVEDWTFELSELNEDHTEFQFRLVGSKTGEDGKGNAKEKFVSNSGRIVVDPDDWNLAYCKKVYQKSLPANAQVKVFIVPQFRDSIVVEPSSNGELQTLTLAQGLTNTEHTLELIPRSNVSILPAIQKFTIYQPMFD